MKVYISIDMEGVAGIAGIEDIILKGSEYERAREWMTGEANAAIEGAFEAGASEVLIADSHGHMRNLLTEKLNEKARIIRGTPRQTNMMEGLDDSFSAAFLVGYHSMAGTDPGVLSHTFELPILAVKLNGLLVGESGFNGAFAGHFGVPVAMVCGDDALGREVEQIMPWAERVVTKKALSWTSADSLTPKASQKIIKETSILALKNLKNKKPFIIEKPVQIEMEFDQVMKGYIAADVPGVERVSSRIVRYTGPDMLNVIRVIRAVANAISGEKFV
jgi:D-amino peptidase